MIGHEEHVTERENMWTFSASYCVTSSSTASEDRKLENVSASLVHTSNPTNNLSSTVLTIHLSFILASSTHFFFFLLSLVATAEMVEAVAW